MGSVERESVKSEVVAIGESDQRCQPWEKVGTL